MSGNPRVIKADQVLGVQPAPFNTSDTLAELQQQAAAAEKQVNDYRQVVFAELAEARERAYREGFDAGRSAGLAQGNADALAAHHAALEQEIEHRVAPLNKALAELIAKLIESRDLWRAQWEKMVVELTCAIAARIVRHAVPEPAEIVRRSLAEAVTLIGRCPRVVISLHPTDAKSLEFDKPALAAITRGIAEVHLVPDVNLEPGSCKLESDFGKIDAGLQTQIQRIEKELTG